MKSRGVVIPVTSRIFEQITSEQATIFAVVRDRGRDIRFKAKIKSLVIGKDGWIDIEFFTRGFVMPDQVNHGSYSARFDCVESSLVCTDPKLLERLVVEYEPANS